MEILDFLSGLMPFAFMIVAFVLFFKFSKDLTKKRLERARITFFPTLETEVIDSGFFVQPTLCVKEKGEVVCMVSDHPGSKNNPAKSFFHFPCKVKVDLIAGKENFLTRIGSSLGAMKDITIGDENLDKSFTFASSSEMEVKSLVRRDAMLKLLQTLQGDRRFRSLRLVPGKSLGELNSVFQSEVGSFLKRLSVRSLEGGVTYVRSNTLSKACDAKSELKPILEQIRAIAQEL